MEKRQEHVHEENAREKAAHMGNNTEILFEALQGTQEKKPSHQTSGHYMNQNSR